MKPFIEYSESFSRLDNEERLQVDYAMCGMDLLRKKILARRALSVLAVEEQRLAQLTDEQASKELESLMTERDVIRTRQ